MRQHRISLLNLCEAGMDGWKKLLQEACRAYNSGSIFFSSDRSTNVFSFPCRNRSGFGRYEYPTQLVSTKWLDGFDHIEPNSIIMIRPPSDSRVVCYSWKRNALAHERPSEADLCDFMRKKRFVF